ncbi:beclin 1-associated autophagy-related key regulator [Drosophila albomicans]|uniref:Beclin 1-associated autophagy-related key regulator n=1 Tax=Drosophila albomicans TaxID=7291 RepID=A0A6P8Z9U4_DROAB|nr:beclin 1-associated autophagy-related key regulator [Drosophila albomicans]
MANSSSSDESSKAPENFQLSSVSENDDDEDVVDVCDVGVVGYNNNATTKKQPKNVNTALAATTAATVNTTTTAAGLRCPLCCKHQRRLHCRTCVKNGNITHSSAERTESLTEKQQKYINLQAGLKSYSSRYEHLIQQHKCNENRMIAIRAKREQLQLLQQLIGSTTQRLQRLNEQRDELRQANAEKRKNLPKYPTKVKMLEDYVIDRSMRIDKLRQQHLGLLDSIKQTARRDIQQLVTYIFPISEVVLRDEQQRKVCAERSEEAETIAALADAKNTSYIRGKWVFHGSGISEVQYRIVGPSLPANGDYSAYLDWLSDNKDDVPKATANEITPSRFEAYRIVGALTYTAQLTQLLSFYLNVRLPHKLAYGDFCRKLLNEEQFLRKVCRVNNNIMYLAYTQQVKLRALNEQHTLENILAILDLERSDLGRYGHLDVNNAPLMKSVDSLLIGIETATESESEDESSLRLDWEAVPSVSSSATQQPEELQESHLIPAVAQQSTIAMAANRITSMLRWIK